MLTTCIISLFVLSVPNLDRTKTLVFFRAVGRRCATLSSELLTCLEPKKLAASSHEPHFQYLVLFILVCHYFEQLDLLEEFGLSPSSSSWSLTTWSEIYVFKSFLFSFYPGQHNISYYFTFLRLNICNWVFHNFNFSFSWLQNAGIR